MTSVAAVPGAPAVILYQEQTQDDEGHVWSFYYRIKVLTEGGRDRANVEIPYLTGIEGVTIDNLAGRTIHADGTVTPFAGKPFDKLLEKGRDRGVSGKVFSLPSVEPGSILEYRYKLHFDDHFYVLPEWYLQSDLYALKEHFTWFPGTYATIRGLTDSHHVVWAPVLPPDAHIVKEGGGPFSAQKISLDVTGIPPLPQESDMPPVNSVSYRVLFYYVDAHTSKQFWNEAGKTWSQERNRFIGPNGAVKEKAKALVVPGEGDEAQLKKIYAYVMSLENTDFSRTRLQQEDKAAGLRDIKNTDDVLRRGRGSSQELAELFVALARAAGHPVYLMGVADRSVRLFQADYLTTEQLDDLIAIAQIDGREVFLDPGSRLCGFGDLDWKDSYSDGLRQTAQGTALASTPGEPNSANRTVRLADLVLDVNGVASGTVTATYTGNSALPLRQEQLRGDQASFDESLRIKLEQELPAGMEARLLDVKNLQSFDQPLVIRFEVKGPLGQATGRRILVPAHLFEAANKPLFTRDTRDVEVDMRFASRTQDAVRYTYPPALRLESAPTPDTIKLHDVATLSVDTRQAANAVTFYWNFLLGRIYFSVAEYPELHSFYAKVNGKMGDILVLTHDNAAAKATPGR